MPLIVRELVIKATLAAEKKGEAAEKPPAQKKEKLITECVEQVIEMMNQREER